MFLLVFALVSFNPQHNSITELPHISSFKGNSQLIVCDRPFTLLSGELYNSSSSILRYLEPAWDKLVYMNLNSVIASISWELVEPAEGTYNFELVDGLIKKAREHHLKLVLIWFGTWKNGISTYVPDWVKKDLNRFQRMQIRKGENSNTISALSQNTCEADARTFAALMKHMMAKVLPKFYSLRMELFPMGNGCQTGG